MRFQKSHVVLFVKMDCTVKRFQRYICPSQATIKYWVPFFKRSKSSNDDNERPERPTSVSTPQNIDIAHYQIIKLA